MKYIDAHAHICEYISGFSSEGEIRPLGNGKAIYTSGREFQLFSPSLGDKSFTYDRLLEIMDENGIERAVLLQGNYLGLQNLYTYEACKKYPSRFVGACMYDPFSYKADEIKKYLLDELHFKIIKLEVSTGSGLMCNHKPFSLNCEEMRKIYDYALKNDVTLVFDIGRKGNPCFQVETLLEIIKEYKDIDFVICHLFALPTNSKEELIRLVNLFNLPNVFFDLASVQNNTREEAPFKEAASYIREACSILSSRKLMWGTDIPAGLKNHTYSSLKNYLTESKLFLKEELEDIYYNTAKKVYFKQ